MTEHNYFDEDFKSEPHHTHPTWRMGPKELEFWNTHKKAVWIKKRNKRIQELFEAGNSILEIYKSGVSGMYLEELRNFIEHQSFRTPDQEKVKELRASMPKSISKLLTDEQVLLFDEYKNYSIDDQIALTTTMLGSHRTMGEFLAIQRNLINLWKLKNEMSIPDDKKRPIILNIRTRIENDDENEI